VLTGAMAWVMLATFTGLPVSTTHAITGALTGAGLVAFGAASVQWSFLGARFAMPLALSPLLSLALVYLLAWPVVWAVRRLAARCVCVVAQPAMHAGASPAAAASPAMAVVVDDESRCAAVAPVAAVTTSSVANATHWASGGPWASPAAGTTPPKSPPSRWSHCRSRWASRS
jgi:PiT family inorganic phosphate transporter